MIETDQHIPTARLHLRASVTNPSLGLDKSCVLKDFTPSQAILVLDANIPPGTPVYVVINEFAFDGEVLYCEPHHNSFEAHVYVNDAAEASTRKTLRFPVRISGSVFESSGPTPIPATIVDISGDGLGIELPVHLPEESLLAVESEANMAFGIVRYSRELPDGRVRLGIRLYRIIPKQGNGQF